MLPEAQAIRNPDLLLATMHDQPIGYNHVLWRWTEITGVRVYLHLGYLLPEWRNKGIGQAMPAGRSSASARSQPPISPTIARRLRPTSRQPSVRPMRSFASAGYTDVRRLTDMAAVLSSPPTITPLPQGIEVRIVEPGHYRQIYQAMKDAYRDMWVSTPESEDDFQEFLADNVSTAAFDPALWQIAWAGDVVAGLGDHPHPPECWADRRGGGAARLAAPWDRAWADAACFRSAARPRG